MQELERGDSGLRSFVSVQGALVMYPILTYGSEEQKQRWLPSSADRAKPSAASGSPSRISGRTPPACAPPRERQGQDWVLNGEKTWITNGTVADIAVVWARTEDGIRGFLVEKGTPGYTTSDIHGKWSMRASVTSSLSFADCRVPADHMLPGAKGLKGPLACLTPGALRNRLGRDRRGHGLLRNGAAIHHPAQAVRRPADRVAPTGAGKAGLDDHRNHQGAVAGACKCGRLKDQGKARAGAHLHAQAEQCRDRARHARA